MIWKMSLTSKIEYRVLETPNYTWQCRLHGNVYWMVEEGKQPNWFHRKTQELIFGIRWEKIGDNNKQ